MPLSPSEMARRAFWSRLYARRRLGTERAQALAAPHYALIGERLGYRPNGFFDPKFFRQAAALDSKATGLMQRYLARPEPDAPPPSAEFDHAWYASQNPDWSRTHPHPFLHFLEVGLQAGRRPRSDIDMAFVRDVIRARGRSIEEAALRVFDPKRRDGDLKPPLSLQELRARQERFFASGRMRIEREAPDRGRKLLVLVQCGEGFDASYLREPRGYDVLLNYFDGSEPNPFGDTVLYQAGTKTTSARRLLELRPDLLLRYEAVLFLDDDVEIRAEDIDALFATMAREGLDLAQPALTADSKSAWPYLKKPRAEDKTFRVSSVEIMAPVFTRRALQRLGWVFAEAVGGWGTDLLLGPAARVAFGPDRIGVVGAVAVRHTRPVDTKNGALYAYLRRNGIDPAHEANQIVAEFGVERFLRRLAPGETGPVCAFLRESKSRVENAGE
ncbi:MAG: DUF707 domain-containing protein [Hyphomicrobiales bacterium]|nr:DUF707 domain-containing protein [Hyphomicrobiales bacterium]